MLSGDRDLWQLVDDAAGISCLYPSAGALAGRGGRRGQPEQYTEVGEAQVQERLGVAPSQVGGLGRAW